MILVRCGAQIQEASQWRKQASKCFNRSFQRNWSDSSDTLKLSETVPSDSLPTRSNSLLLMRMWLGYASTITWQILQLQTLWPTGSIQAATELQISHCEDGMHSLDGCSRICVEGGHYSGCLEGGRMGDNLEFFDEVLGLFWCFVYFIITLFIFIHEGLYWKFTMLELIIEMFVFWKGKEIAIGCPVWL